MITTITLNAALDIEYRLGELRPGTVMRVKSCRATAGGKGLNVARVAAALGESVCASGFLGGHTGARVEVLLDGSGIVPRFLHVPGESRTCINIIDDAGGSTELLEPGVPVDAQTLSRFLDVYEELLCQSEAVTLNGSLPAGCPDDFYAVLIHRACRAGVPVLLDTSGAALSAGLKSCPTLVKPNQDELRGLLGFESGLEQSIVAAKKLHRRGIRYVVLSLGAEGALMVCREGVLKGTPPQVAAVNTVGCGDSMIAAFAVALRRGYQPEEMLRYALEVSSASAMHPDTGGLEPAQAAALRGMARVEKIETM